MNPIKGYFAMLLDAIEIATFVDERKQVECMFHKRKKHYERLCIDIDTSEGYNRILHDVLLERVGVFAILLYIALLPAFFITSIQYLAIFFIFTAFAVWKIIPADKERKSLQFDDTGLDVRFAGLLNYIKSNS